MGIYGANLKKERIIPLSLHKIRRKNKNPIYTTVPFYYQNGELSVLKKSTCMDKTRLPF